MAKTKRRANIVITFALIAWMALATVEAQNLVPSPARLSGPGMPGQPAAPTQELTALPGQQPIQPQNIQRSSATDAARYLAGMPVTPEKWNLRFFGTYTGPINLFKNFYQPALRQYYATSSPKPLTFGFGYQYDRQDARLLLEVRR